jgi:hypothetical protein
MESGASRRRRPSRSPETGSHGRDGIDGAEEGAPARRRPRKPVAGSVCPHAPRRAPGLCPQGTGATVESYRRRSTSRFGSLGLRRWTRLARDVARPARPKVRLPRRRARCAPARAAQRPRPRAGAHHRAAPAPARHPARAPLRVGAAHPADARRGRPVRGRRDLARHRAPALRRARPRPRTDARGRRPEDAAPLGGGEPGRALAR